MTSTAVPLARSPSIFNWSPAAAVFARSLQYWSASKFPRQNHTPSSVLSPAISLERWALVFLKLIPSPMSMMAVWMSRQMSALKDAELRRWRGTWREAPSIT